MAAALSVDLRTRVMDDLDCGMSADAVAAKYSVSTRTVFAWKALRQETGGIAPRRGKTGPKPKLEPHRDSIMTAIRDNPDVTLNELKSQLNLPSCLQTLANALHRWGLALKKSHASRRTATA